MDSIVGINPHSDAIDIYLVESSLSMREGLAQAIPSLALLINQNFGIAGGQGLSHELGHCLGLKHPDDDDVSDTPENQPVWSQYLTQNCEYSQPPDPPWSGVF